jgi:hypothetical protein
MPKKATSAALIAVVEKLATEDAPIVSSARVQDESAVFTRATASLTVAVAYGLILRLLGKYPNFTPFSDKHQGVAVLSRRADEHAEARAQRANGART